MGKVYRHKPSAPDEYLGRVEPESGKVYRHRLGPDEYLGQVHLDDGEVYSHRLGPDQYVAKVKSNGRIYGHKSIAPDDYLGKVEGMHSLAEGGAAFFLLLLPVIEGTEIEAGED